MGPVATYTWEGNPTNISCEVQAHPRASVVWYRDNLQLPIANTTNTKIYNTPTVSYLEVRCTLTTDDITAVIRMQRGDVCNDAKAPNLAGHVSSHILSCLQQL